MIKRSKRLSLQLKFGVALVLMVTLPLSVAYILVGQLGATAANVAASDASARVVAMEKAIHRYHELVNLTKRMHGLTADRLAKLLARNAETTAADPQNSLREILDDPSQAGLRGLAILGADGQVIAEVVKPSSGAEWRDKVVDEALGTEGSVLRLTFEVSASLQQDLQELTLLLQDRLDFKETMNWVFIHPEPKDREMFFGDHFTLNTRILQNVVTIGYKRAMAVLRRYDFTSS